MSRHQPPGAEGLPPRGDGAWAAARRILVVRLDGLGDLLMSTPAIRALAGAGSTTGRQVTLLTSPAGAAVASLLPEVAGTIVAEVPWAKRSRDDDLDATETDARLTWALAARLRREAFEGAVILTVNTQSALPAALVCLLAGIPLRLAHARENPYGLLSHWVPDPEPLAPVRHEVRRQLDLVATIGATVEDEHLSVRVPPAAARDVRARLARLGIGRGDEWVVLHPGASAPSRRYPTEAFAAVARSLVRDHGVRLIVTGGAGEEAAVRRITAGLGRDALPLPGPLAVDELAALLAVAPVFLGNNSGPAHLAAAVGTPVVDLYALTNLQHAPWGVPSRVLAHDVPCKGCRKSTCPLGHHACLRGVAPSEVVAAVLGLLHDRTQPQRLPGGVLDGALTREVPLDDRRPSVP